MFVVEIVEPERRVALQMTRTHTHARTRTRIHKRARAHTHAHTHTHAHITTNRKLENASERLIFTARVRALSAGVPRNAKERADGSWCDNGGCADEPQREVNG